MPNFIKLTTQSELPAADEAKEFPCGDKTICIANVNGTFTAMDNVCLHQGGPLGEGTIENGKVVCPWHGYEFSIRSGFHQGNSRVRLRKAELTIRDGEIYVSV